MSVYKGKRKIERKVTYVPEGADVVLVDDSECFFFSMDKGGFSDLNRGNPLYWVIGVKTLFLPCTSSNCHPTGFEKKISPEEVIENLPEGKMLERLSREVYLN